MTTQAQVEAWIENYVHAWTTADPADIAALFTADGEYHESPYTTEWIGRDAIVEGWLSRQDWQEGGWTFTWNIVSVTGDTAVIEGTGVYKKLGTFANHWTVTFAPSGEATKFVMINNEV